MVDLFLSIKSGSIVEFMVGVALFAADGIILGIYERIELGYIITSKSVFWMEIKITNEKDQH